MTSTRCVVRPHRAGLFSNINKIVACFRMYDEVGVDWSAGSLYGDCWNQLFKDRSKTFFGEVDQVHEFPFYDLTAACAGILYQNPCWRWRARYHGCWNQLGVLPDILSAADRLLGAPEDAVAVLIRSKAIAGEQLSDRTQPLDEYAFALSRALRPGSSVFVMSSDVASLNWMRDRFPCIFDRDTKRALNRDLPEPHLEVEQTAEDAKRCLVEVLAASRCRALVHPVSNMATAALYINPALESIYLK